MNVDFKPGNRHNFLLKLAKSLNDTGISMIEATNIVTTYARSQGDTEDREYITELVYHPGGRVNYILGTGSGDDRSIFAVLSGPAGASFDHLRKQFAELFPDKATDNTAFVLWLCEDDEEWYEANFREEYM